MYQIFVSGGWLMWPILLCSIIVVAISIERFITLKTERIVPAGQLAQVWQQLRNKELNGERLKALRDASPLGYILAAGISNSGHGRDVMKDSIEESAGQVIHQLERFLATLGTIANATPLLGLLGTVLGMIQVFADIMLFGTGNAAQLAGGISQALITTAAGLTVAIPAMVLHRYFERHVESLVVQLEGQATKLVDAMHSDLFKQG
ncbi:MAG: MotA/TolQ/ExbB proton channel family protein [Porticoccaceae bacterium]|nr:MotA/TolQ/ExbB proton channel family protein [Porticoccaceae bacterium]